MRHSADFGGPLDVEDGEEQVANKKEKKNTPNGKERVLLKEVWKDGDEVSFTTIAEDAHEKDSQQCKEDGGEEEFHGRWERLDVR